MVTGCGFTDTVVSVATLGGGIVLLADGLDGMICTLLLYWSSAISMVLTEDVVPATPGNWNVSVLLVSLATPTFDDMLIGLET